LEGAAPNHAAALTNPSLAATRPQTVMCSVARGGDAAVADAVPHVLIRKAATAIQAVAMQKP
jgi:hypothetical protein